MIASKIQLYCDGDHGIPIHFPEDGALDGTVFSHADLRREAHKEGWRRTQGDWKQDLCPECAGTIKPKKSK